MDIKELKCSPQEFMKKSKGLENLFCFCGKKATFARFINKEITNGKDLISGYWQPIGWGCEDHPFPDWKDKK